MQAGRAQCRVFMLSVKPASAVANVRCVVGDTPLYNPVTGVNFSRAPPCGTHALPRTGQPLRPEYCHKRICKTTGRTTSCVKESRLRWQQSGNSAEHTPIARGSPLLRMHPIGLHSNLPTHTQTGSKHTCTQPTNDPDSHFDHIGGSAYCCRNAPRQAASQHLLVQCHCIRPTKQHFGFDTSLRTNAHTANV